jgi:hypothetical protein
MRAVLASVLVVGLVAVAAGCGGGKKSAPPTTTATTAAATTQSTQTKPSAPAFASTQNCARLAALGAQIAKSVQATSGNVGATVANEAKVLQEMANAAPSDIRGDFQTFVNAFNGYLQALTKAGLTAGKTPTAAQIAQLTKAAQALSTAKLQAAEQHLSGWAQKNCGG